jgi:hypothetical protein
VSERNSSAVVVPLADEKNLNAENNLAINQSPKEALELLVGQHSFSQLPNNYIWPYCQDGARE